MFEIERSHSFKRSFHVLTSLALALSIARASDAQAVLSAPVDESVFTILARRGLIVGNDVTLSGPIGVLEPGGTLSMGPSSVHTAATRDAAIALGDIVLLKPGSRIVDLITNDLRAEASAVISGVVKRSLDTPFLSLPRLPAAVFDACVDTAAKVRVSQNSSRTLSPGCYGDVIVQRGGQLFLQPGEYRFRSWKLLPDAAIVSNAGEVSVHLRDRWSSAPGVLVGAASSLPEQFRIFTAAPTIDVREEGVLIANLFAPNTDWLVFWPRSVFQGHAVADRVLVEDESLCGAAPIVPPPSATPAPSATPSGSPTPTPTPTRKAPTPTPPTPTPTGVPPRLTPTPTVPMSTPTPPPPPTPTLPVLPPTPTPAPSPTASPEPTPTLTSTPTPSPKPPPTPNPTSTPQCTPTPTKTPKPTSTPQCTPTPTKTPKPTATTASGSQGCTPGYWRQSHHYDSWVGYQPSQSFGAVFGVNPSFQVTLGNAVALNGGGEQALARHAVAALLNAAHPGVRYAYTEAQVLSMVQAAYTSGNFESTKNWLEKQNEKGCPLD